MKARGLMKVWFLMWFAMEWLLKNSLALGFNDVTLFRKISFNPEKFQPLKRGIKVFESPWETFKKAKQTYIIEGGVEYVFYPPLICPTQFVKSSDLFFEKKPDAGEKLWGPFF